MSVALNVQIPQFFDDNGDPLAGGKVYIYEPGTSTPAAIFQDAGQSVPAANPVILNSVGKFPTPIFIADGTVYDMVVYDSADVLKSTTPGLTAPLTSGTTPFANSAETIAGASSVKAVTPAGGAAAYDRKGTAAAHTAGKSTAMVTLAPSGAAVTPDFAASNVFRIGTGTPPVLAENITLNNPTNPLSGQGFVIIIVQDATGGRTVSFGAKYKFVSGVSSLNTAANAKNKITGIYDPHDDVYLCEIGPNYT